MTHCHTKQWRDTDSSHTVMQTKKDAQIHTHTHTQILTETHTRRHHTHTGAHSQTHIHTQTHTGTFTVAHFHSQQKDTHTRRYSDTHTKTHRCRARSTEAEPCRQRGFERGQPAPRTQTSQLCSPPRNPPKRQEKFLGY